MATQQAAALTAAAPTQEAFVSGLRLTDRVPRRWVDRLPVIGAVSVFGFAGVVVLFQVWHPFGDYALTEIIVRHFWSHPLLYGPYSITPTIHHPLPWFYVVLWVPYQLFGQRSAAMMAAIVWLNAIWLGLLLWLTARRGAIWLGISILALIAMLSHGLASGANWGAPFVLPWNPNIALLPLIVLVVVVWQICLGEHRLLPLAMGLAVWCGGAHYGFIPSCAAMVSLAVVVAVIRAARPGTPETGRAVRRSILIAAGVGAVMASPAIVDVALHGTHSNPVELWRWYRHSSRARLPRHQVVQALFGDLAVPPAWLTGRRTTDFYAYTPALRLPLLLIAPIGAAALAWLRRATAELVGLSVAAIALGFGVASLLGVRNPVLISYFAYPMRTAIIVLCGFTLWSLGRSAAHALRRWRPAIPTRFAVATPWVAGVVAIALTALMLPALRVPHSYQQVGSGVESVMPAVERAVPKGHTIVLEPPDLFDGLSPAAFGLALDRAGYTVRYPWNAAYLFGPALTVVPSGPVTRLKICRCKSTPDVGPGAVVLTRTKPNPNGIYTRTPLVVYRLPG